MLYVEAKNTAVQMDYLKTAHWNRKKYLMTRPSRRLGEMLEPWRSSTELWRKLMNYKP
ncbi:MAG: hypothetical protein JJU11_16790 [Candidatus Sumerlaeia bacterium]|nr:hypothetical protein [Candidatus Sumerlaeia bacterium]